MSVPSMQYLQVSTFKKNLKKIDLRDSQKEKIKPILSYYKRHFAPTDVVDGLLSANYYIGQSKKRSGSHYKQKAAEIVKKLFTRPEEESSPPSVVFKKLESKLKTIPE